MPEGHVRPIGDQLCSLHCWLREHYHPPDNVPLEKFIRKQLAKERGMGVDYIDWQIPAYWHMFDYIDVLSYRAFARLSERVIGVRWSANSEASNSSDNRGYHHYCEIGEVSTETQRLLADSVFHQRFTAVQERVISRVQ